jgi:hypothetical protein
LNTPINLNRARKERARLEARAVADQNAAKHGLSKAERVLAASRNTKAAHLLDQHKTDDEE